MTLFVLRSEKTRDSGGEVLDSLGLCLVRETPRFQSLWIRVNTNGLLRRLWLAAKGRRFVFVQVINHKVRDES